MAQVVVKSCDPMRLVAVRHVGPYMGIGDAFMRIADYGRTHNLEGIGTQVVGVYHDDPKSTPEAELRSDAGLSVPSDYEPSKGDEVHMVDVAGGEYACLVHEGHYATLGKTYREVTDWIRANGRMMSDKPCCEVYLNTPRDTAPEDLRTEVRVPIA
jgi:AraC family transcriptional regulator